MQNKISEINSSWGASAKGQDAVGGRSPSVPGPSSHQIADVDGESSGHIGGVDPIAISCLDLQAPEALLTVEKGKSAPVGMRTNPELSASWRTGLTQRWVPIDVEGVRATVGRGIKPVGIQPEGGGEPSKQLGVDLV